MARRYVSDIIGEDYKRWKEGDRILISTTTGTGKTHFILHTLLRYAKEQEKHLVYFCNRKFLSLQVQAAAQKELLNELGEDEEGLAAYLHIRTYQHSEKVNDYPHIKALDEDGKVIRDQYEVMEKDVLYYVFDEAHYFVQDATFNRFTRYWQSNVRITKNEHSISLFLTATPEPFYLYPIVLQWDFFTNCQNSLARYYVAKGQYLDRWTDYLDIYDGYSEIQKSFPWGSSLIDIKKEERQKRYEKEPYYKLLKMVNDAYHLRFDLLDQQYRSDSCYDYADTYYFNEISTLANLIAQSVKTSIRKAESKRNNAAGERIEGAWLVFVSTLNDAKSLQLALKALGCSSVIISSKFTRHYDGKPAKRRSSSKKIFDRLINEQYLDTYVLISTSVLDCGITVRSGNVANLVLCQPNRTSFLQMLGRIRVEEDEKINLYIQSFTPKQIQGFKEKIMKEFAFLVQFKMINEIVPRRYFRGGPEPNLLDPSEHDFMHFLPSGTRNWLLQELEKDPKKRKYMISKKGNIRHHYDITNVDDLIVNDLALIYYLGQVYYIKNVLPEYGKDPYYFLKEQLSWIGKTYDPTRWIDYDDTYGRLYAYLEKKSQEKEPMNKDAQMEFRQSCLDMLKALHDPPDKFQKVKARYSVSNQKFPDMKNLNEIFAEARIPYQITSKQNKKQLVDKETGEKVLDPKTGKPKIDNKTYWRVEFAELQKVPEQKKQEAVENTERIEEQIEQQPEKVTTKKGLKVGIMRKGKFIEL